NQVKTRNADFDGVGSGTESRRRKMTAPVCRGRADLTGRLVPDDDGGTDHCFLIRIQDAAGDATGGGFGLGARGRGRDNERDWEAGERVECKNSSCKGGLMSVSRGAKLAILA